MKKTLLPLLSTIFILFIVSCENEPLEGFDLDELNNIIDPIVTPTGLGSVSTVQEEASSGDYWPRAINNEWNFNSTFYGPVSYDMISTETIDGIEYYKFDELFGAEAFLRKSGDVYYTRSNASDFPLQGYEVTTSPIEVALLKDSAEVGDTWTTEVDYLITYTPIDANFPNIPAVPFQATYMFEMMGRDLTRTVEGNEYTEVLHVELTLTVPGNPLTEIVDYYYAKDVGLIEASGSADQSTLTAYSLN